MSANRSQPRRDYLSWDEYFMAVARLSSKKSADPTAADQVGACIVDDENRIVATGFNEMPRGCGDDDDIPWTRRGSNDQLSELDTKTPYVCHAEYNAILNKQSADVRGCTIYVTLFPCNECAKLLIQSGIREVVYSETRAKHHYHISEDMLRKARVTQRHFIEKSFDLVWSDTENDTENDTATDPQTLKRAATDLSSQENAISTRPRKRQRSQLKQT